MHTVIAYDIVEDKRRNRVAELLKDYGARVQYSVFEFDIKSEILEVIVSGLEAIIDPAEDQIRIYTLCEACRGKKRSLGKTEELEKKDFLVI